MNIRVVLLLVLSALLLLLPISPSFAAEMSQAGHSFQVCLSEGGIPSDRCFKARRFGLSLAAASINVEEETRLDEANLVVSVDPQDFKMAAMLAEAGFQGDSVNICIIDGANICPPEPFIVVRVCITTGMLAGETCPPAIFSSDENEVDPVTTLTLRSVRQGGR